MKKILVVIALAIGSFTGQAQSKIGTIDADFILAQMPEIEEVNKGLETYATELQKDLDTTITKYEVAIKEYQEKGEAMPEEERIAKEGEIITLEKDIQGFRQKAAVMLQMKRNELTQPLYDKINSAMAEVVQAEGFTQIFHAGSNALAYSQEESDITVKVLGKLGIELKEE